VDRKDKMVLQFRDVLAETERLSPDELEAYQRQLLEPLLLHARQHVPFYAQRLAPVFPGGKLDLSRVHEIPTLRARKPKPTSRHWRRSICRRMWGRLKRKKDPDRPVGHSCIVAMGLSPSPIWR